MRYNQAMTPPDFNLLLTLDALLAEGSVAGAARRLRLSPSAMSRALARLREATGDPLLVRAGRGLVATPRAQELRERVGQLVQEAESVLRPAQTLKLAQLDRSFTLRTREGLIENFGAKLIARASAQAPGVQLCFVQKTDKQSHALREGSADLEIGVVGKATSPEVRSRALFRDRFVGVVRIGHPLPGTQQGKPKVGEPAELAESGELTPASYAGGRHISVSRLGLPKGQIDDTLATLGLERQIATVVGSFASALALARGSDLIASVPERQTGILRAGMHSFALPFPAPQITVSLLWHPRFDADPAHRWLRALVQEVCGQSDAI